MEYRIKDLCKEKGITLSDLANQIGMKSANLSAAISPSGNPTIQTLNKIAEALEVSFTELFEISQGTTASCPHCGGKIKLVKG